MENRFGTLALTDLLKEKGGELKIGLTTQDIIAVDIKLPDCAISPSELTCDDCGDKMRQIQETTEFPFERAEIIIRFHNALYYVCDKCNIKDGPEDTSQGEIMGQSLQIIIRQLAVRDLTVRRTNLEEIRSVLS